MACWLLPGVPCLVCPIVGDFLIQCYQYSSLQPAGCNAIASLDTFVMSKGAKKEVFAAEMQPPCVRVSVGEFAWLPEGVVPLVTGLAPEGTDLGHDDKSGRKHATVVAAKSGAPVIPHLVKDCNASIATGVQFDMKEFYKKLIATYGSSAVWTHAKEPLDDFFAQLALTTRSS